MTFWEWLHRLGPGWPDARGVIGIAVYSLVVVVLALIVLDPSLRADEFFKTIATLIIGAFIKDIVAWAYSATKGGGELAAHNAEIVRKKVGDQPTGQPDNPLHTIEEPKP